MNRNRRSGWIGTDVRDQAESVFGMGRITHAPDAAHAFFANLLPEGPVRAAIARRLKVSEGNDYSLLAALGGDCAGALSISSEDDPPQAKAADYRKIPPEIFSTTRDAESIYAAIVGDGTVRLSLAGAQDKLPVYVEGDSLYVPYGGAASNAILKLPSNQVKNLPENETFMSLLAGCLGMPTCDTKLVATGKHRSALVSRYDRFRSDVGVWRRLHQEDFCQILNVSPTRKYEAEGGPSFAQVYQVVQDHSVRLPGDSLALLRWLIFNLLTGNADGHAKNLALLRTSETELSLAPFYDLVCTRIYPRIDRMCAMRIGDRADPGEIGARDFRRLAEQVGVSPRFVLDEVKSLADQLPAAIERAGKDFKTRFGASPIVTMITKLIRDQVKRTLHLLSEPS